MAHETNYTLINKKVPLHIVKKQKLAQYDRIVFHDYLKIQKSLKTKQNTTQHIILYDITTTAALTGKIFSVKDHINRIGHNPFVGQQKNFKIDFINTEKIYVQTKEGIITNSCGEQSYLNLSYPSTHLANIAIMAHIYHYKVSAYLINIKSQDV